MKKLWASPLFNVSLLALSWALQIFVAKLGLRAGAELYTFSIQSLFFIVGLMALYILPRKHHIVKKLPTKTILYIIAIGTVGAGIGGTLSNAGLQLTTAINAGFLFQFDIALTIIFAWALLKEKLDIPKILMLLCILLGTFFLTTNGQLIVPHSGDIFILLASACFAAATVFSRQVLKLTGVDPDMISLIRPLVGLVVLLSFILLAPFLSLPSQFDLFNSQHLLYVFFNALFCVTTVVFLNRTLKVASASYTAMVAAVTPIFVALFGIVFLQETLTSIQLIGAFLIVLASFITHLLKVDKH
jgi:drug/metabolite transporter (DMT)-like permease